jgi:hypothetical protein
MVQEWQCTLCAHPRAQKQPMAFWPLIKLKGM